MTTEPVIEWDEHLEQWWIVHIYRDDTQSIPLTKELVEEIVRRKEELLNDRH